MMYDSYTITMSYLDIDPNKRHILSLSGGKDSTALAVYLKDKIPDLEYVFCDTGEELRETYAYLDKIEEKLQIKIKRLGDGKNFDDWLKYHKGYLPSARARWCTVVMKIRPYERYVGKDNAISYMGIRADECDRGGYISKKGNITPVYPFREDNIVLKDVYLMLIRSGLGIPEYYKWRSRSGCYFCFFQRMVEWVRLMENHPDLFDKAQSYEKKDFTWIKGKSLDYIRNNAEAIKKRAAKRDAKEEVDNIKPCDICHL